MFDLSEVSRLTATQALNLIEQAQHLQRHAEVTQALAMLRMVKTYRHQIPTDKVQLGGLGTGLIDDFACLELAAALHRNPETVTAEVIELLDLETRLPRLWEITVAGGVPIWQARRIARTTNHLTLAKALWVDSTLAPFHTRLSAGRLQRFAHALTVQVDPAAAEARWAQQSARQVKFGPTQANGLREVYGWLNPADAIHLDAALDQLSNILAAHGSNETAAERRATALGILATPARALALIQHSINQPHLAMNPADEEPASFGPRDPHLHPGHSCGTITVPPGKLLPKATLVIHLSDRTLLDQSGVGRCDQLGPLTINQIRQVLSNTQVTVQPVFNPNGIVPVDSYEIPEAIRRAVLLRHRFEVFPYGTYHSTGLDLDHTHPFQAGKSGQTRPDNLGPLRRKAHRAKTHAGWQLTQTEPGRFLWRSPLGRRYLVTPAGLTNDLQHPSGSQPWDNPLGGPLLPSPPGEARQYRSRPRARRGGGGPAQRA